MTRVTTSARGTARLALAGRTTALALAAVVLAGCFGPAPGETPMSIASLDDFATQIEPHLEARCALGGCHGRADRPLSFYAPGVLRADPARTWLDEHLSDAELASNAAHLCAFALERPADASLALCTPLAPDEGGCGHGGGAVFADRSDPAYRAIARWLDSRPP